MTMDPVVDIAISLITSLLQDNLALWKQVVPSLKPDQAFTFRESLGRLHLWAEGFPREQFLIILTASRDLRVAILLQLRSIGKILQTISSLRTSLSSAFDSPRQLDSRFIQTLQKAESYAHQYVQDDLSLLEDEDESEAYSSDGSETTDDVPLFARLDSYIRLLMRLVPSMERTLLSVNLEHNKRAPNNIPIVEEEVDFCSFVKKISDTTLRLEDDIENVFALIPLTKLQEEARAAGSLFEKYVSAAGHPKDKLQGSWKSTEDNVIKVVSRWFKRDFFTYQHHSTCRRCKASTRSQGMAVPKQNEYSTIDLVTEVRVCNNQNCLNEERIPLSFDVQTLLQKRKGHFGEGVICLYTLYRAMGAKVRWVWCPERVAWLEVHSEYLGRWIHFDPYHELWDRATIYTEGWNNKLSYCIAFSEEGPFDVTDRYVRDANYALPRNRVPETILQKELIGIQSLNGQDMIEYEEEIGAPNQSEVQVVNKISTTQHREVRGNRPAGVGPPSRRSRLFSFLPRSQRFKFSEEGGTTPLPSSGLTAASRTGTVPSLSSGTTAPSTSSLPEEGLMSCRICAQPATLSVTRANNRISNSGRKYWKCYPCNAFVCWEESVSTSNSAVAPLCRCGKRAERSITRPAKGRRIFYHCIDRTCDFFQWAADQDGAQARLTDDVSNVLERINIA